MYDGGRYFTVTGRHLDGTPTTIEERTTQLAELHARIFPPSVNGNGHHAPAPMLPLDDHADLIDRASAAANGAKFRSLWNGDASGYDSHSEADIALCNMLAFWTDRDPGRIDRLFRQSGLFREKWDERRGERRYGEITIGNAIASCRETYTPGAGRSR